MSKTRTIEETGHWAVTYDDTPIPAAEEVVLLNSDNEWLIMGVVSTDGTLSIYSFGIDDATSPDPTKFSSGDSWTWSGSQAVSNLSMSLAEAGGEHDDPTFWVTFRFTKDDGTTEGHVEFFSINSVGTLDHEYDGSYDDSVNSLACASLGKDERLVTPYRDHDNHLNVLSWHYQKGKEVEKEKCTTDTGIVSEPYAYTPTNHLVVVGSLHKEDEKYVQASTFRVTDEGKVTHKGTFVSPDDAAEDIYGITGNETTGGGSVVLTYENSTVKAVRMLIGTDASSIKERSTYDTGIDDAVGAASASFCTKSSDNTMLFHQYLVFAAETDLVHASWVRFGSKNATQLATKSWSPDSGSLSKPVAAVSLGYDGESHHHERGFVTANGNVDGDGNGGVTLVGWSAVENT